MAPAGAKPQSRSHNWTQSDLRLRIYWFQQVDLQWLRDSAENSSENTDLIQCKLRTWCDYCEQHSSDLLSCVHAEPAAVEATVFLRHVSQEQADIKAADTVDRSPVAVVFAHQVSIYLLTNSNNGPGLAVGHPFQNDLVNGTIVLVITADGHVVAQLCYQH